MPPDRHAARYVIKRVKGGYQVFIKVDIGRIKFEIRYQDSNAWNRLYRVEDPAKSSNQDQHSSGPGVPHNGCIDPVDNVLPKYIEIAGSGK